MGNMLQARVTITGTRPLLWHHFGPDAIPLERGERTGVAGNDPEEWRKTVLATKDGQLYLESSYIFSTIRDGAKHTKSGRGTMQTAVASTLQVVDDRILLDRYLPDGLNTAPPADPEAPVYLDVRSVKNPQTRGRNVRYRVAAPAGWSVSFIILWDKTIVQRNVMEAAVRDAGRFSGVGDGRAIGFGRFAVDSFEVSEA